MEVERRQEEASSEGSQSFVKALQELKNLKPQLYSAAQHSEKSYQNSDQKQMVLHNLKDYAVKALVTAVDHLGTVAYNLNHFIDQNTDDISSLDFKIKSLNQKLLTCRTYEDQEGLRQQQVKANIPRHHKHYTLPSSVNKKVHFSPLAQTSPGEGAQPKTHRLLLGTPATNTLSWHLASETKPSLKGPNHTSNVAKSRLSVAGSTSSAVIQTFGIKQQVVLETSRPATPHRYFDSPSRKAIIPVPIQSKSMFFACLLKQKTQKPKSTLLF